MRCSRSGRGRGPPPRACRSAGRAASRLSVLRSPTSCISPAAAAIAASTAGRRADRRHRRTNGAIGAPEGATKRSPIGERRLDGGNQRGDVEGFRNMSCEACFPRALAILATCERRDRDYRWCTDRMSAAQLADELEAVHARHSQITQDDICNSTFHDLQGHQAIGRGAHFGAQQLEQQSTGLSRVLVVFDEHEGQALQDRFCALDSGACDAPRVELRFIVRSSTHLMQTFHHRKLPAIRWGPHRVVLARAARAAGKLRPHAQRHSERAPLAKRALHTRPPPRARSISPTHRSLPFPRPPVPLAASLAARRSRRVGERGEVRRAR